MRKRDTLPLGDAAVFTSARRRTFVLRLAVLAASAGALAAAILLLPVGRSGTQAGRGAPDTTLAVVDVSGSISGTAPQKVASLLDSMSNSDDRRGVGLVLFSDTAYVLLPPGTSPAALRPFTRYFRRPESPRASDRFLATAYMNTPWQLGFSRGTTIASGLNAARRALVRAHVRSAEVVLASDLFDSSDRAVLARALSRLTSVPGVQLSLYPLPPFSVQALSLYRRYTDRSQVLYTPAGSGANRAAASSVPVAFLLAIGALLVTLAAQELLGTFFSWGEDR